MSDQWKVVFENDMIIHGSSGSTFDYVLSKHQTIKIL